MEFFNRFKPYLSQAGKQAGEYGKSALYKTAELGKEAWKQIDLKKKGVGALHEGHKMIASTKLYRYTKWGLISAFVIKTFYVYGTSFSRDITVQKTFNQLKERKTGIKNEYMVADEKARLYKVSSSVFFWQWFPDELYSTIKEGERYRIQGYGVRIRQLGIHPRIVHAYNHSSGESM